MSDERLREAERRWLATRRVEDEAALLRERARIGLRPTQEELQLAAWCGHEKARLAMSVTPPVEPEAWADGLVDLGPEAALRFLLELGRELRPAWEESVMGLGREGEPVMAALRAAEVCLRIGEEREQTRELAQGAHDVFTRTLAVAPAAASAFARVVALSARLVADSDGSPSHAAEVRSTTRTLTCGAPVEAVEGARRVLAREALRLDGVWNERGRVSERELEELLHEASFDRVEMWWLMGNETINELPPPERRARILEVVRRMLETGRVVAVEYSQEEHRYVPWALPVHAVIERLARDWAALGAEPGFEDLAVLVSKERVEPSGWSEDQGAPQPAPGE